MKKFSLAGVTLRRPITIIMVAIIVVGFGVFSLTNLKITLYPTTNIPILAISTGFQNVAPEDVNRLIVNPIEGAISAIEGIEEMEASISRGSAFIRLSLQEGANMRKTELQVREAIDQIRNQLPAEAREPTIFQFDPENRPIMRVGLTASNRGLDELRTTAIEFVEPRLERIEGLASADTRGGLERRIYIDITPFGLAQHKLTPQDIQTAISQNNVQLPIGNVVSNRISYSVRAQSIYTDVSEIENTIVKIAENGIPVRVRDVAKVENGFTEINNIVTVNGKNSVSIDIQKTSDANTLDVVNAVKAKIPELNEILPPGVSVELISNEGKIIDDSINNLASSALAALIVVVVIILIVMGGWRVSLVVASTIPVSMAASFAAMYAAGLTLNLLTISALALAIGLLVDNAIVVTESIARKLEEGVPKFQAALEGTNEVIGALLGSTLTTLGVFLPIIALTGIQGQFFRDFAITICFAIGISFIASILLVPVLSLLLLNRKEFEHKSLAIRGIQKLQRYYVASLRWMLFRKWIAASMMIGILGGVYFLYTNIETEAFPESDSGEIDVRIQLPQGSKLVATAEVMNKFAEELQGMPEIRTVISSIGQNRRSNQSNQGEISLTLVEEEDRDISTSEFALMLRDTIKSPGVNVRINANSGGALRFGRNFSFGGGSIRLSLIGPDIDVLQAYSDKIEEALLQDENVISVDNGRSRPTPELHFYVDRQQLGRVGANLNQVAGALRTQALGSQVGFYRLDGREIPIEVRTEKETINSREDLFDVEVLQVGEQRVPVAAVGEFRPAQGLSRITRRDRETVLDLSIQVNGDAALYRDQITSFINEEIVLPDGYRYDFTGATRNNRQTGTEFLYALLAAVVLMFMIMASLFENFRDPFIIWLCIPMAIFGALLFLTAIGSKLSTTGQIGMFMLVGIIVNNGIVLVDYMHIYTRNQPFDETLLDKVLEACKRRMRPIILTALTTICSMIPLAIEFGSGSEIWSPLAKAVIGGLMIGAFLTLFIVPSLVMGISKGRRKAIRLAKVAMKNQSES